MSLSEILVALHNESKASGAYAFCRKYGLIPLIPNGVKLSSGDLMLIMKNYFGLDMEFDELKRQLPAACASLNIKMETAKALGDPSSILIWIYLV